MDNCIFCKIGKGEIPAHKVYDDKKHLAFLDVKPHSKGHTVVIPKAHGVTAFDFSDLQLRELMVVVRKTMSRIQKVLLARWVQCRLEPEFGGWAGGSAPAYPYPAKIHR